MIGVGGLRIRVVYSINFVGDAGGLNIEYSQMIGVRDERRDSTNKT